MQAPLAIVDVETTGSDPRADRVTEIAVLLAEGGALTSQWTTLLNPATPIPGAIQALTGISQDMVNRAPRFAEIAEELAERLAGRVFVAHNARFDYGFLRREFERAGIKYHAKTLCTVRLSRRLYPGAAGHDLDSLIARHGLECETRHRALPDAAALWQFLRIALDEHGEDVVDVAARQIARQPAIPPHLDRAAIDEIPEAPGVYLFYEGETPLYIGKSRTMRSRVLHGRQMVGYQPGGVGCMGPGTFVGTATDYEMQTVSIYRTEVQEALIAITGQNFGFDRDQWRQWWRQGNPAKP